MLTVALLGAALVLCATGWLTIRRARAGRTSADAFLRTALPARAEVVELRERYRLRAGVDEMPTFFPVVAFTLPGGARVESEVLVGARPAPARVGATVDVRYDPEDPRRVALARGRATVGAVGCFATGLGVALWVLGVLVLLVWVVLKLVLRVPA